MSNVASGELAVYHEGREYIFRPSFRAMAAYGTPQELKQLPKRADAVRFGANLLPLSCALMTVCCDEDISPIIGYWEDRDGKLVRVPGRLPDHDIIVLAMKLATNGIAGDPDISRTFKPSSKESEGGGKIFDPAEFAAAAMVHFGFSRQDAWEMTMVEFQRALVVKFPDSVADIPSKDEYKASIETVKRIRELAKNG